MPDTPVYEYTDLAPTRPGCTEVRRDGTLLGEVRITDGRWTDWVPGETVRESYEEHYPDRDAAAHALARRHHLCRFDKPATLLVEVSTRDDTIRSTIDLIGWFGSFKEADRGGYWTDGGNGELLGDGEYWGAP